MIFLGSLFILSTVAPVVASTYYTHYYTVNMDTLYSNYNWGSDDAPRYYVQISYYGLDQQWHDQNTYFIITANANVYDNLNPPHNLLNHQEALYRVDSNTNTPIKVRGQIGYDTSCWPFNCAHSYWTPWNYQLDQGAGTSTQPFCFTYYNTNNYNQYTYWCLDWSISSS